MYYKSVYRETRQMQRIQNVREIVTSVIIAVLFVGLFMLTLSRVEYIISIH